MKALERLRIGAVGSIVIVAAHPDDEVIGAGAQLLKWENVTFVHTTDGAPRDMRDAIAAGFSKRTDYAIARQKELGAALRLIAEAQLDGTAASGLYAQLQKIELGFVDQETPFQLVRLARALTRIIGEISPDVVVTHPYEGGHPDHDSTAFAVHAACQLLRKKHLPAPDIVEFTSYHSENGAFVSGEFLPPHDQVVERKLTESERAFKRRLFQCFATQRRVLEQFEFDHESFRIVPTYDFSKPPHEGRLYYEQFDWQMTGERWRRLAGEAVSNLGLESSLHQSAKPQKPIFAHV